MDYFRLAEEQGGNPSLDATVQRANLVRERGENELAFELYRSAFLDGSFEASWHLGYMYWRGLGVKRDRKKALHFFKLGEWHSRFSQLRGLEALGFGIAHKAFENR